MKIKHLLFFIFLFPGLILSAQDAGSVIDGNNIDAHLLGSLFLKRLNELRVQQKLNTLGKDSILSVAGKDQADYMSKTGEVGHIQKTKNRENPTARVVFYKGTNDRIGENCIEIPLHLPYKDKQGNTVTVNSYNEAADALFTGWKNSKPHYHNMITPYYDVQGIGFSYDSAKHQLYSSNVFGTKAYIPPKNFQVVDNAWGITAGAASFPAFFAKDIANFVHLRGDSIFLYYSLLNRFKQYIKNGNDGVAIDLVAREQFNCNHNNNLHGSPVFDGWMLEPVYFKTLMRGNYYKEATNELYTYIGKIPSVLKGRDIQENVILINNKHSAGYSYPVIVEEDNLPMLRLDTYWDTIRGRMKTTDTFNVTINHYIEFKRGISKLSQGQLKQLLLRIGQYSKYINKIELHTFSSIEGSTEENLKLQKARADNIKAALTHHSNHSIEWQIEEKENWDAFYKQIEGTPFTYLKNYSKEDIKQKLKDLSLLDSLDVFLAQQRTAVLSFSLKGQYSDSSNVNVSRIALQSAIAQGDSAKAWLIQSEMINYYEKGKMDIDDIVDNDVPVEKKYLPLLANIVAAKAVDIRYMYDPKFKFFVKKVFAIGKNFTPLKLSYCVCAINYLGTNNDTLISNEIIENYLKDCSGDSALSKSMWRYYLDYYVAAAYYNWYRHKYDKMDICLEGIKKYYPSAVLKDSDYIKLGKLFNMYYRVEWTFDMLYPIVKKGTTNEDLLFLFITSTPLFMSKIPQQEYITYLKQARSMDEKRFCRWIGHENWQLLREDFIKALYCETCNDKQ